jgi:hypothetical protein
MLKHIARNSIDDMPLAILIDYVNHSRLLLVSLSSFAIQVVHVKHNLRAERQ